MLAPRRWIPRAPLEAGQHLRPMTLLDNATASNAGEAPVLGMLRVERREHVVPFEHLHVRAVRTGNERHFLRAGFKIPRDPTTGQDERRRDLKDFAELNRAASIIGLCVWG